MVQGHGRSLPVSGRPVTQYIRWWFLVVGLVDCGTEVVSTGIKLSFRVPANSFPIVRILSSQIKLYSKTERLHCNTAKFGTWIRKRRRPGNYSAFFIPEGTTEPETNATSKESLDM